LTHFFAKSFVQDEERYWLFALKPETGKTHQLRVAMKSLASPVFGDRRYEQIVEELKEEAGGVEGGNTTYPERGYLHAYKMRFDLFGKRYEITDPAFEGERFDLKAHLENTDIKPLLSPEKLSWPKRAFKLSV